MSGYGLCHRRESVAGQNLAIAILCGCVGCEDLQGTSSSRKEGQEGGHKMAEILAQQ